MTSEPCDGIVCFAGVDWWYHNAGHSERQIMVNVARRLPVLWVNSIGMRLPIPGRTELPWRRIVRKLKSAAKGLRRDPSGVAVLSPLFVPIYSERGARINGALLRAQVAIALRRLGVRNPAAWVTVPSTAYAVLGRSWARVLFNRSDLFSAFPEVDHAFISSMEGKLLKGADEVLYVNHELMAAEVSKTKQSSFLGHGVDFEHFAAGRTRPEPTRLQGMPRPIIGFYGALDDYTIDLPLMCDVARAFPNATVLVIGPQAMELDALLALPNVHYLGPIPYVDLPSYAARFDLGIMPWLRNEWIRYCNPIKLKEYLAVGFPIVTVGFPELEPYRSLVGVADDGEEFVSAVKAALANAQGESSRRARQDCVRNSSWANLADRVLGLVTASNGPPS